MSSFADNPTRDQRRAETGKAAESRIGVDLSRVAGDELRFLGVASSIIGACGIVLLLPLVILLIGTPIALSVRALIEAIGWLAAAFSS